MRCPICDQKPMNCDCTPEERRSHAEINALEEQAARLRLTEDEREAFAGLAAYCDTRASSQAQRWGSMLRVMLERTK